MADCPSHITDRPTRQGYALLLAVVLIFCGGKAVLFDTLDPDFFWHYRVAGQLLQDGIGPVVDQISFASDKTPWTPYSWLAELGMKWLWDHAGLPGVILCQSLMVAGIFYFLALSCRVTDRMETPCLTKTHDQIREPAITVDANSASDTLSLWERDRVRGASHTDTSEIPKIPCSGSRPHPSPLPKGEGARTLSRLLTSFPQELSRLPTIVATAFATMLALPYLSFRPATAATLILSINAYLLLRDRAKSTRLIWLIPALTLLCINLHFFAVFAVLWIGAMIVGDWWETKTINRRYLLLLVLTSIACCGTPMLPGMIGAMLHYGQTDPMVQQGQIAEFIPFWRGNPIITLLIVASIYCIARQYRRHRAGELIWLAGMLVLSVKMGRFLSLAVIILAPLLARSLPRLSDRPLRLPAIRLAAAFVLMLGLIRILSEFPSNSTAPGEWLNRHGPDAPGYPVAAAEFVRNHVAPQSKRILNEFTWGGYLSFTLEGKYQVLMDGRTQVYSPAFWEKWALAETADEQTIRQSNADAAILPLDRSRLAAPLLSLGWKEIHRDDRARVLVPPTAIVHTDPNQ